MEYSPLLIMPQSSLWSRDHLEIEIGFFGNSGRYITFSSRISLCLPSLAVNINLILPIPNTWDVSDTPLTLIFGDSFMSPINNYLSLQIWNVAQLSIFNSVGWSKNEKLSFSAFLFSTLFTRLDISVSTTK